MIDLVMKIQNTAPLISSGYKPRGVASDVLSILMRDSNRYVSSKDAAVILDIARVQVSNSFNRLFIRGLVERRKIANLSGGAFEYRIKKCLG